jgi:hypothetical protein
LYYLGGLTPGIVGGLETPGMLGLATPGIFGPDDGVTPGIEVTPGI